MHHDGVLFAWDHLGYFDPEVRYGLRKATPDFFEAATDWHDTVLAIGKVSSLCGVSAKSQHAFDVVSVVGGKKLFGDRLHIWVVAHMTSIGAAVGGAAYAMVRTIRKRASPDIMRA